jgi:multiple RNA-binding domain-containing protein 1
MLSNLQKGDETIARPWSKYSEGSSAKERIDRKNAPIASQKENAAKNAAKKQVKKTAEQELLEKVKTDPNLKAYVEAMKPRSKGKVWENEGDGLEAIKDVQQQAVRSKKAGGEDIMLTRTHVKFEGSDESSDEEYDDLPARKGDDEVEAGGSEGEGESKSMAFSKDVDDLAYLKSKATSTWKDSDEEDNDEEDADSDEDDEEEEEASKGKKSKKAPKKVAKKVSGGSDGESSEEDGEGGGDAMDEDGEAAANGSNGADAEDDNAMDRDNDNGKEEEEEEEEEEDANDTGRLFLRNLAFGITEDDLRRTFGKFGELSEVHLCMNKETKRPNGLAFVMYLMPQHATHAREKLDGKFMQGRLLHIIPAKLPKSKDEAAAEDEANGKGGYKAQKEKKMKEQAGSSHNWNMLFMRADTVADAAAASHNMKKGDLLDADAESMAVRMALAETHVIEATKQRLAEEGVNVAAFTVDVKPKERSRTVILVKNLPYSADAGEVQGLFSRFGDIGRVVLPDTKTVAIVEMAHEGEAKKAFKSLAYSRFKQQPLYLEWGPVDTFVDDATAPKKPSDRTAAATTSAAAPGNNDADVTEAVAEITSVYIKNVAFDTNDAKLRKAVVKACGGDKGIKSVRVVTKASKGGKGKDKELSAGYAFVEFASSAEASAAVGKIKGVVVDGKALQPELSKGAGDSQAGKKRKPAAAASGSQAADDASKGSEPKNSSKIIVRNVPFEANKKELRSLLGTFGQLSTLRLPKKFDGKHRGFAFADFLTHQEAAAAKKALEGTHLYGRHLVIEYAEEDNSLEAIRLKTARYFSKLENGADGTQKRRKLQDALDGEGDDDDDFESNFA